MQRYRIRPPERHLHISQRFIPEADEWFEKGDMPEASEMAWGAVAHYLKSIAKRRGWRNRSHRDLALIAERLANESYDTYRIHTLYRSANSLHVNFYEDWLDDDTVRMRIEETKEFVGRLEKEFPE